MMSIESELKFASDRSENGMWCNHDRSLITQRLTSHVVSLRDGSSADAKPTLANEGFELVDAPLENYRWDDEDWVQDTYLPHCSQLVREATGASFTIPLVPSILVRDTTDMTKAPAAEFVHIDTDRRGAMFYIKCHLDALRPDTYSSYRIYNVWRSITPPPQDTPLALCDQRSFSADEAIVGYTITEDENGRVPYVTATYDEKQQWWTFSSVSPDQAILFKGFDSEEAQPMGCLHGAFRYSSPECQLVPRASAETRIVAFFR